MELLAQAVPAETIPTLCCACGGVKRWGMPDLIAAEMVSDGLCVPCIERLYPELCEQPAAA